MSWTIECKLRPCKIIYGFSDNCMKALFHTWTNDGEAIVESESGRCYKVHPERVVFLDHPFDEYIWDDNGGAK